MTKKPIEQIHTLIVLAIVIYCSSILYLEEDVWFLSIGNTLAPLILSKNYTIVLSKTKFFTRCKLICLCQFRYQSNPTLLWAAVLWLSQYSDTLTIKNLITHLDLMCSYHMPYSLSVHGNRNPYARYFIRSHTWNVKK